MSTLRLLSRFRDLPIRQKLTWVNILTSGVALALACLAFIAYDVFTFRQAMARQLATQAELVGYSCTSALVFNDRAAAMQTLRALKAEPHIIAAVIYTKEGEPFANYLRYDAQGIPPLPSPPPGKTDGHLFRNDGLIVFQNMVVDHEAIGSLRIVSDLTELNARLRRYVGIVAAVFLLSIAAAIPLLSALQRVISGPIMHLVERAKVVTNEKNYAVRAVATSQDELGQLTTAFNEMLAQIQQRETALKKARDEAEAANRAKDEFLAVVSHELRTPLTPVLGWTRMLRGGQLDEAGVARAIEVIERNVKAQAQLIEDLLDVSRIITGKLRLEVRPLDLIPVVEAAVDSLRPTAEAKEVLIETTLDPRAGTIAGDADRLQQILWNLISNAIKFTSKGGHVQVQLERLNAHVVIAVHDTGKGIAPEFLPYVFDRFRQADSTSTRAYGGLGLGLAIVRHLVELHGGRIRADSAGEDQGSTFTVELPGAVLQSTASTQSQRGPGLEPQPSFDTTPNLLGLRVLVVDDEADTLEAIRLLLEQRGARVHTALSAADALNELERWLPEVLVSDIGMPGEDGYELIRKVRARDPDQGGRVPALALTAYARVEDRVHILAAGFQMHVHKPVEPAELLAVIASLAGWREGAPIPTRARQRS